MLGLGLTNYMPIVVYIVGIFVILMAIFKRVDYPFMFLVGVLPLTNLTNRMQAFPLGKDAVDILLLAIIIGWFARSGGKKGPALEATPLNKIVLFHIVYTYIGLWIGSLHTGFPYPFSIADPRFMLWKNYIIAPLLFFVTVNTVTTKDQMRRLVYFMIFVIFAMGASFFNNYRWISKDLFRDEKRGIGTFAYLGPNEWAAFHAHYVFVMLGILFTDRQKMWQRIMFTLAVILSIYCVLFSYSRGGYIALAVGIILICLWRKKWLLVPIIIFFMFWQTILPRGIVDRIHETKTEYGELDHSSEQRIELWEKGWDLFKKNPIFGYGFATIPYIGIGGHFKDTHNYYIEILSEQGVIGFLILCALLLLALKSGWRLYTRADDVFLKGLGVGFVVCVLALLITNAFGDRWTYLQISGFFWVFLGLVARGNLLVNSQLQTPKSKGKR